MIGKNVTHCSCTWFLQLKWFVQCGLFFLLLKLFFRRCFFLVLDFYESVAIITETFLIVSTRLEMRLKLVIGRHCFYLKWLVNMYLLFLYLMLMMRNEIAKMIPRDAITTKAQKIVRSTRASWILLKERSNILECSNFHLNL